MYASKLVSAAISLGLGSLAAHAQDTFLIDFGNTENATFKGEPFANDPENEWNNLDQLVGLSDDGILFDLVKTDGTFVQDMNVEMVRRFNGVNTSGSNTSEIYPDNATRDSMFGNTEVFGAGADFFPSFRITGLDPSLAYTLTFYASRLGAGDNRETEYTVTGGSTEVVTLNPADNIDDMTVEVAEMAPGPDNQIQVDIAPGSNNDNGFHFTYLGVLKIETSSNASALAIVGQPEPQSVVEYEPATFTAGIVGAGPFDVQWYRVASPDDVALPGAGSLSFTIPEAQLSDDGSMYYVTVANATETVTSETVTLSVTPDVTAPTILSARTGSGKTLLLSFSEPLDPGAANAPANYTVTFSGGTATVTDAILEEGNTDVTLEFDAPLTGEFTVAASGVTDRSGNMPAGTAGGLAPEPGTVSYLFDFGGASTFDGRPPVDDPLNFWNNVSNDIGQSDDGFLDFVVTTLGTETNVALEMIRRFNGTNQAGNTDSALFPATATGDSLYGNTFEFNELSDIFPSFKLTGLDMDQTYTLTFYANRLGVGDNRETEYTVTGNGTPVVVALNPSNNMTDESVSAEGLVPNGDGEIIVGLEPSPNNDNANLFTYLSVLKVDSGAGSVQPATDIAIASIEVDSSIGQVTLVFEGQEGENYVPSGSGDLSSWVPIDNSVAGAGGETTLEFTDPGFDPGGQRYYRIEKQ